MRAVTSCASLVAGHSATAPPKFGCVATYLRCASVDLRRQTTDLCPPPPSVVSVQSVVKNLRPQSPNRFVSLITFCSNQIRFESLSSLVVIRMTTGLLPKKHPVLAELPHHPVIQADAHRPVFVAKLLEMQ